MSEILNINRKGLYLIAFLEGAFVMALELVGARYMAPFFGSSIIVWTIVLTVVVVSLAIGYFIGGKMARNVNAVKMFTWIALSAAVIIVVLPVWAAFICGMFVESEHTLAVIMSASLILVIPYVLFGMLPPILIEIIHRTNFKTGIGTGNVFAFSTVGGIFATFLFGYWLIPDFGLKYPLSILSFIFSLAVVVFLVLREKTKGKFRWQLVVPVVIFIAIFFMYSNGSEKVVKYHTEGLLGQVVVAEVVNENSNQLDRILFVNRMGQTWEQVNTGNSMWGYPYYLNAITSCYPAGSNVLLLGLGGGTVAKGLENQLQFNLQVVELDERMEYIAKRFYNYRNNKIVIDDARHYLRKTRKEFDIIIFDVFKGEVAPSYVLTLEAFEELKKRLNPGGLVVINFNGFITGKIGKPGRSILKTLKEAGYNVDLVPTYGEEQYRNMLFLASLDTLNYDNQRLNFKLRGQHMKVPELIVDPDSMQVNWEDAIILTDDQPNLEILNIDASQSWRDDYRETFRKLLPEKDLPMYK